MAFAEGSFTLAWDIRCFLAFVKISCCLILLQYISYLLVSPHIQCVICNFILNFYLSGLVFLVRKGLGKKTKRCSVHVLLGKFCHINIKKGRYREWCITSSNNKDFPNSILKQTVVTVVTGEEQGQNSVCISEHRNVVPDTDATWLCEKREGVILARQGFS